MRILVLNGSPRSKGNTARMVDAFAKGAREAGHTVQIETVANQEIHGCLACEYCHGKGNGACIQQDDMQALYPAIRDADMLVLASPIYYYTMTGQLISALDRTYALGRLSHIKKTALILSSGGPDMYDAPIAQYRGVIAWWGAEDAGIFPVQGLVRNHSLENTPPDSLEQLYQFGKGLRE